MRKVLKKRLITAFTLGPLFIWGVLSLPTEIFAILIAMMIAMGGYEWAKFLTATSKIVHIIYSLIILGLSVIVWWSFKNDHSIAKWIFYSGVIWWVVAFVFVVLYPKLSNLWNHVFFKGIVGILVLVPCWTVLVILHMNPVFGPGYTLFVIMLMWMADSGAYFGGRRWGKTKLAANVSPGKTLEGVYTALAVATVYTIIASYLLGFEMADIDQWGIFLLLSLLIVPVSVLGDLTESMFKRATGIKDSGSILPGHGGVLDRIDSLTAAAPIFLFGLLWWKGISITEFILVQDVLS